MISVLPGLSICVSLTTPATFNVPFIPELVSTALVKVIFAVPSLLIVKVPKVFPLLSDKLPDNISAVIVNLAGILKLK